MSGVGAFVHLYHIWGVLGLLTAVLFGMQGHRLWRESGGNWRDAPREWAYAGGWSLRETIKDVGRFAGWVVNGFLSLPYTWRQTEWSGRSYPSRLIIFIGITCGGVSRFLTALYWAEKNRGWMTEVDPWVLEMAALPVILAVVGDLHHHRTAWPSKTYRVRLIALVAFVWVIIGAIRG